MAVSRATLDKHLVQVRRIAEHREAKAEQNIRYYFSVLKKDLNSFLGNEYARLAQDDKLTYAILQQKGEYARFLEEVISRVDGISPKLQKEVQSLIEETYKVCYKGLADGVAKVTNVSELAKEFKAISAVSPETVRRAVQNPIKKLTLTSTLEKNRKNIVSNIRREIAIGLTQGDRMSTMAKRISRHVEQNYRKSMLIARTEAHRVRESGFNDAANEVNTVLIDNDSEYRMTKTWRNMRDIAVRHTNLANHVVMEGVTVLQDEDFELSDGSHAPCPGSSGVAAQDCNCRCYLSRRLMSDEEYFQETGKHFAGKAFTNGNKSGIINNKVSDIDSGDIDIISATMPNKTDTDDYIKLINNSHDGIKHAYKSYTSYLSDVRFTANDGYYSPISKEIVYSFPRSKYIKNGMSKYSTLAHEYGHFIDDVGVFSHGTHSEITELNKALGGVFNQFKVKASSSDEFLEALRKDKAALRTLVYDSNFRADIFSTDASAGLQDAIDGMFGSNAGMGWHHGDRYYNRKYSYLTPSARKTIQQVYKNLGLDASNQAKVKAIVRNYETASELWANIMSAVTCGGLELDYIKKYLPYSYQAFISIIGGLS